MLYECVSSLNILVSPAQKHLCLFEVWKKSCDCRFRDLSVTESEQASLLNSCLNMYKTQWCLKFSVKSEYKIRFERGLTLCANLHKGSRGIYVGLLM